MKIRLACCSLLLLTPAVAPGATFRWAFSSRTIYVIGPGSTTLTSIHAALPAAPLTLLDPATSVWTLGASLTLQQGATLLLHGSPVGGDVNELRLQSLNSPTGGDAVRVRAQWGTIDIRSTRITSWDDTANGPDTDPVTRGRAYIQVRSFLDADGVTPRESRMDITDSEIAYLGFNRSESYGLSWKVLGGTIAVLQRVRVFGDIVNSRIHHGYHGVYTFGALGMHFLNNEIDSDIGYGFDAHDDSDDLVVDGNRVHDNGLHGIIASKRCNNLTISRNESHHNLGNGIMLHRQSDDSLVEQNHTHDNGDGGIALFDSSGNTLRGNTTLANGKDGIRLSVGSTNNIIEGNELAFNGRSGLYLYKGNNVPTQGSGRPRLNQFLDNAIHDHAGAPLVIRDADVNVFHANVFSATVGAIRITGGVRNRLDANDGPGTLTVQSVASSTAATETIISGQPLIRIALDIQSSAVMEDVRGAMFDAGVPGVATMVTTVGSSLRLTRPPLKATALVVTRPLWAAVGSGSTLLTPVAWETAGDVRRKWITEADSAQQEISYTVGELSPNAGYGIWKAGALLASVTADAAGTLHFADVAGTTLPVTYTVLPVGALGAG